MRISRRLVFASAALLLLGACSSQSGPSSQSIESTTTTIPADAPSPWVALENLAKQRNAVDFSRVSTSHQGIFAIAIVNKVPGIDRRGDVVLFQWDGRNWNDVNARIEDPVLFENADKIPGDEVTTYDFDHDGINDFLISYFDPEQMMRPMGGVLSIGDDGKWYWLPFRLHDGSTATMIDVLNYNVETGNMDGEDFVEGRQYVSWRWNSASKEFLNFDTQIYADQ